MLSPCPGSQHKDSVTRTFLLNFLVEECLAYLPNRPPGGKCCLSNREGHGSALHQEKEHNELIRECKFAINGSLGLLAQ